ncbi:hypothetical protein VNO78_09828 [Psophocarpus tetragonolobus]|uniref:Uncharacterized protein n=1 Tax=Psophocarpus tetragonolobus TaxID=3891 RepID=A0AAN9XUN0_PSOTE
MKEKGEVHEDFRDGGWTVVRRRRTRFLRRGVEIGGNVEERHNDDDNRVSEGAGKIKGEQKKGRCVRGKRQGKSQVNKTILPKLGSKVWRVKKGDADGVCAEGRFKVVGLRYASVHVEVSSGTRVRLATHVVVSERMGWSVVMNRGMEPNFGSVEVRQGKVGLKEKALTRGGPVGGKEAHFLLDVLEKCHDLGKGKNEVMHMDIFQI